MYRPRDLFLSLLRYFRIRPEKSNFFFFFSNHFSIAWILVHTDLASLSEISYDDSSESRSSSQLLNNL